MEKENTPLTDDGKVVLDTLIVDVGALFKKRHGHFLVTDARDSGGHALCGTLESANRIGGSVGEVEHG